MEVVYICIYMCACETIFLFLYNEILLLTEYKNLYFMENFTDSTIINGFYFSFPTNQTWLRRSHSKAISQFPF